MATFNVSDWVYYDGENSLLHGALGYIEEISSRSCVVQFVKDIKGKPINTARIIDIKDLMPARTSLTKENVDALIDLALATRDFEWCRQLTEQYKRVAKARV